MADTSLDVNATMSRTPTHLEPSELGTREYWDALYAIELANHTHDPSDTGTNWFDDSGAQDRIIAYLEDYLEDYLEENSPPSSSTTTISSSSSSSSSSHPQTSAPEPAPAISDEKEEKEELGRKHHHHDLTSFLDLGTGNGAMLFALRDAGFRAHPMCGLDYSARSVELARRIGALRLRGRGRGEPLDQPRDRQEDEGDGRDETPVHFHRHDMLEDPPADLFRPSVPPNHQNQPGNPPQREDGSPGETAARDRQGWHVVLDKGTFDAICLAGGGDSVAAAYRRNVLVLVRPGGIFLVTSCNWTEEELGGWFTSEKEGERKKEEKWGFEKVGRVMYPRFSFGGVEGQTTSTVCFRKVVRQGDR